MTSTELLKEAEERLSIASYQLEMSKNLNNNRLQKAKEDEYDFLREVVFFLRAQQDTPPNDPLTLEQLREMDGEPVWVRNHCTGAYACRVIDSSDAHFTHFTDGGLRENRSYGSYWTAYRRKPEEGTA